MLIANSRNGVDGPGRALLAHLTSQGRFKVCTLNVRDVFFHARALGMRGKTDGVDPGVIARHLVGHHAFAISEIADDTSMNRGQRLNLPEERPR